MEFIKTNTEPMGEEIVVSLENVSKCYKRYVRPVERLKEILLPGRSRAEEFWALQDINLEISKGEALGIIGQNGSGKSTLLQIIAKTLTPTTGEVKVNGRVAALLELGSGFNPEFTGRQNVFFNGRLLGLREKEIEEKFDSIVAFADIGDFLDQPVKTYSSGMFVRLAFAVAVSVNPDILIVDEALAVGDVYFQQRCFERIRELRSLGTTLLFVSHDTAAVYRLCSRAVLMESGKAVLHASARQVVDLYEAKLLRKIDSQPDVVEIKILSKSDQPEIQDIEHSLVEETELRISPDVPRTQVLELSAQNNEEVIIRLDDKSDAVEIKLLPQPDLPERQEPDASLDTSKDVVIDSQEVSIESIKLLNEQGQEIQSVVSDHLVQLSVSVRFHHSFDDPHVGFKVRDRTGFDVFLTNTYCMGQKVGRVVSGTLLITNFKFHVPLMEGEYTITIGVADGGFGQWLFKRSLLYKHNVISLKVLKNKDADFWWGIVNLSPTISIHRQANA